MERFNKWFERVFFKYAPALLILLFVAMIGLLVAGAINTIRGDGC